MSGSNQQGTTTVSTLALTDRLPQPVNQLVDGQYRTSDVRARLATLVQGDFLFELFDFSTISHLNLVLFSSDVPTSLGARSSYATSFFGTTPVPALNLDEPTILLINQIVGGADMTQPTAVGYQKIATVALATAGFSVLGYSAVLNPIDRELNTTSGGTTRVTAGLDVNFTSNSGVIDGWAPYTPGANLGSVTPILLRSTQYTAAIQAAGNIIVDGIGRIGRVVGLYEPIANA